MISGGTSSSALLLESAWTRVSTAFRPSTCRAHQLHFRTFLAFLVFMNLPVEFSLHNILVFLEYLYQNHLSPQVIKNYVSSLASMARTYNISAPCLSHISVSHFLRSITINSAFRPTPRGVFDIRTLYHISKACDGLADPPLFRAIFLTAFYAFLRISNIAPHSAKAFDPTRHFLRQDLIFHYPGAHLLVKWTKTLQDNRSHHLVQLPKLENVYLCPVRALSILLASRKLPSTAPLFANNFPPFTQVIDTHVRDALRKVLTSLDIPHRGHGFHTFRRSGATFAFHHNASLQDIMAHGLWRSSAVWLYLQNSPQSLSSIPLTFASAVPAYF